MLRDTYLCKVVDGELRGYCGSYGFKSLLAVLRRDIPFELEGVK